MLSGLLAWDALKWDIAELGRRYGAEVFRPGPDGGERLQVLVDATLRGEPSYSYGCAVPEAMRHEFPFPLFEEASLAPMQLWLGTACKEPVTGLHRDLRPVLLAQVLGRKKLTLFPPHQAPLLYPRRVHNDYFQGCWVDAASPDLEVFPLFDEATPLEVILHPGELLYLPVGWFHYVHALDQVLSVSTIVSKLEAWQCLQ